MAVEWNILLLECVSPTASNEVLNRVRRGVTQGWAMRQNQQRQDDHWVHDAQSWIAQMSRLDDKYCSSRLQC